MRLLCSDRLLCKWEEIIPVSCQAPVKEEMNIESKYPLEVFVPKAKFITACGMFAFHQCFCTVTLTTHRLSWLHWFYSTALTASAWCWNNHWELMIFKYRHEHEEPAKRSFLLEPINASLLLHFFNFSPIFLKEGRSAESCSIAKPPPQAVLSSLPYCVTHHLTFFSLIPAAALYSMWVQMKRRCQLGSGLC